MNEKTGEITRLKDVAEGLKEKLIELSEEDAKRLKPMHLKDRLTFAQELKAKWRARELAEKKGSAP